MGKFVQGVSGNPAGRPKGLKNRVTIEMRQIFKNIVEGWSPYIDADLRQLEPKDRLKIILEMTQYFLPKQSVTQVDANVRSEQLNDVYSQLCKLTELNSPSANKLLESGAVEDVPYNEMI